MSVKISGLAAGLAANLGSAAVLPVTDTTGTTVKASIAQLAGRFRAVGLAFDPKDPAFGAVGDGVTDDTTAWANCIAAAVAAGGATVPTPGTYLVANVTVPAAATLVASPGTVTLKLKTLTSLDGSPILNVTGAGASIYGLSFNGNKAAQPADGFADAFDTGTNGTGRAYRAAIKFKDATYTLAGLTVDRCSFVNTYGACVATNGVSKVSVTYCVADSCNFELAFIYNFGGGSATKNHRVIGNRLTNGGSGDATVNGDCYIVSFGANFVVAENQADTFERNLVKIEKGVGGIVANNVGQTNTKANFEGIQLQGITSDMTVIGNRLLNTQKGITMNGNMTNVSVVGNNIDTLLDATAPDGISIGSGTLTGVLIAKNIMRGVPRYCIGIQPSGVVRGLSITGNAVTTSGLTTGAGILLNVTGGNWRDVQLDGNEIDCGSAALAGAGIYLSSGDGSTVALLKVTNNLVDVGTGHNGIREASACVSSGLCDGNLVDGALFLQSAGFRCGEGNMLIAGSGNDLTATGFVRTAITTPVTVTTDDRTLLINLTTPGAVAVTLPQFPQVGRRLRIKDSKGDAATNNITITVFAGYSLDTGSTYVIKGNFGAVELEYVGSLAWRVVSSVPGVQPAITTPNAQTASYVQADVTSLKTAIDAIRTALINAKITT